MPWKYNFHIKFGNRTGFIRVCSRSLFKPYAYVTLAHDVVSGTDITTCIKIDKHLHIKTAITPSCIYDNIMSFAR